MSYKTVVGDIHQMGEPFSGALGFPFVAIEVRMHTEFWPVASRLEEGRSGKRRSEKVA